jgi:small subunit ribosomal protein S7
MRRREAAKREILPDPLYKSVLVSKFINTVMKEGKKSVAEKIVYGAFVKLQETKNAPEILEIFEKATVEKEKLPDSLFSNDSEKISWFNFPMPIRKSTDYEEGEEFPNKTYPDPEYAGKLLKEVFFRNGQNLEIYLDYEF